jgi:outer membrane immunogenic protein
VQNWGGGYLGVHGGLEVDAFKSSASPNIPSLNFSGKKNTKGLGGGSLGVQAGYNWQSGNLVYGVEAEASRLMLSSKKEAAGNLRPQANSRYAAKARLGYSFGSTMVFGTAGLALSPQRFISPPVGATPGVKYTVSRLGPILGVGVEHKLTQNISLRGEVDYALHGERKLVAPAGSSKIQGGAISAKAGVNWHF